MADGLQPHYPSMKGWRLHWDMQLFKALEHQYQMGLEGLHSDLPPVRCELEFKGRRLQLRPALEDLRTDFYKEIKKFISIPTGFKGLGYYEEAAAGGGKEGGGGGGGGGGGLGKHRVYKVFRDMPDRNVDSLLIVYQKAGELFAKLEKVIAKYRPHCVLGMYDGSLEDLVEETVTEPKEYDDAYKQLRQRRKEVEKLPNAEKVDCVNVNLAPLKSGDRGPAPAPLERAAARHGAPGDGDAARARRLHHRVARDPLQAAAVGRRDLGGEGRVPQDHRGLGGHEGQVWASSRTSRGCSRSTRARRSSWAARGALGGARAHAQRVQRAHRGPDRAPARPDGRARQRAAGAPREVRRALVRAQAEAARHGAARGDGARDRQGQGVAAGVRGGRGRRDEARVRLRPLRHRRAAAGRPRRPARRHRVVCGLVRRLRGLLQGARRARQGGLDLLPPAAVGLRGLCRELGREGDSRARPAPSPTTSRPSCTASATSRPRSSTCAATRSSRSTGGRSSTSSASRRSPSRSSACTTSSARRRRSWSTRRSSRRSTRAPSARSPSARPSRRSPAGRRRRASR